MHVPWGQEGVYEVYTPNGIRRILASSAIVFIFILFFCAVSYAFTCFVSCSDGQERRKVKQIKIGGSMVIAEVEESGK